MKNGNLIFIDSNGRKEIIKKDMPFALLQHIKKQIQDDIAYRKGKLLIVANYKKEKKSTVNDVDSYMKWLQEN